MRKKKKPACFEAKRNQSRLLKICRRTPNVVFVSVIVVPIHHFQKQVSSLRRFSHRRETKIGPRKVGETEKQQLIRVLVGAYGMDLAQGVSLKNIIKLVPVVFETKNIIHQA